MSKIKNDPSKQSVAKKQNTQGGQDTEQLFKDFFYAHEILRDYITLKDGHEMSVQASLFHYCEPRDSTGPYTHVEIGFPSFQPSNDLLKYAEDPGNPHTTVYGYVPAHILLQEIERHGGLDENSPPLPPLSTDSINT